jgi:nitrite reductase/ring-hydroxylating ferredoxin subunit
MREWDVCALADLAELGDPGARPFEVGSGDWPFRGLLVRRGGEVHAYENSCPHRGHPLNLADDDVLVPVTGGHALRCASHGALFVPETGVCFAGPGAGHGLRRLACRVVEGRVLVTAPASMREAERT